MNTHYRDQVVALQIREETFIHESSAGMDSKFMKLKDGIDAADSEKSETESLPWLPGNLFDLGRVDDGASGTCV